MSGITDIGANAAQASQSGSNGDYDSEYDYERFDLDGSFFGKQHPTTAVVGEAVALRKLYDENDRDRADVAVILDDPDVITSEEALENTVVVHGDDESDDFKVVNLDDSETKQPSDTMVDFDGNTFYGSVEDDFGDMDQIALKRGGGAGRRITSTLDVKGALGAQAGIVRDDETGEITSITLDEGGFPQHNGGYIEYHPEGRDGERPRQARDPELRPDVEGQQVVIMVQRLAEVDPEYEGSAYWATVFANLEDDRMDELAEQYAEDTDGDPEDFLTELGGETFLKLEPTDEFDPDEDLLGETGWIQWAPNTLDRSSTEDIVALNTARLEADFGNIYVPEGMSVSEATPEGVDVEMDADREDVDSEDTITAFGKGSPDYDLDEAEA